MDPLRADKMGIQAADVEIVCFGDRFSGKWVARVIDGEREHVLTEDKSVYRVCRWKARLRRIQTRYDAKRQPRKEYL